MLTYKKREISDNFFQDLQHGPLETVLAAVQADDTVSLNIRANYVCLYHRGGCLLKITERGNHAYEFEFDHRYAHVKQAANLCSPKPYSGPFPKSSDVAGWVALIPTLKFTMDLWFGASHEKREREYQQFVERTNNTNYATDYFICDVEYTNPLCRELRADLVALHWPSTQAERRQADSARLAIIEMKFGDAALGGPTQTAGIVDHVRKLGEAIRYGRVSFDVLGDEMLGVFKHESDLV